MREVKIMLIPSQEICKVEITPNLIRNNLAVVIIGNENYTYCVGDYFPEAKQVQFYGARLTKKQIDKIFELIEIK
tara:strand:- start:2036 stop:2260 length:225 start_codon:yes stop_codon:yes gene_type:complete